MDGYTQTCGRIYAKHVDGYTQNVDAKLFIFHISGINIDARPCICYNLSMRGVIMKNDLKLRQSNNLILASHQMDINQMRIFFYVCSQYNGDLKLSLSFNEMNNILNVNRGTEQKKSLISSISTMMRTAFVISKSMKMMNIARLLYLSWPEKRKMKIS